MRKCRINFAPVFLKPERLPISARHNAVENSTTGIAHIFIKFMKTSRTSSNTLLLRNMLTFSGAYIRSNRPVITAETSAPRVRHSAEYAERTALMCITLYFPECLYLRLGENERRNIFCIASRLSGEKSSPGFRGSVILSLKPNSWPGM